jgi:hypothetical protein
MRIMCLCKNPQRHIVRRWNWKTACLSSISRGIIIFAVNLPSGGACAVLAMCVEMGYRGLTAGFFSAAIQAFRFVRPYWTASMVTMALIPGTADGLELVIHKMHGTSRLGATILASVIITALSTLFELFAMRHGVMVVGKTGGSFSHDLKRIPLLIITFLGEGARLLSGVCMWMWKSLRYSLQLRRRISA